MPLNTKMQRFYLQKIYVLYYIVDKKLPAAWVVSFFLNRRETPPPEVARSFLTDGKPAGNSRYSL